jgi:adenylosuccinate lyase
MIDRYRLPEISEVWSEDNKYRIWLDIELLAAEANSRLGLIPSNSLKKIKSRAKFNIKEINRLEQILKHDVIAFLTNVASYIGKDSRFIHYGMTSSDVLDTALAVQMKQAGKLILRSLKKLKSSLVKMALKYRYLMMIGRTHGVHAEPITLGLKFAVWVDEVDRNIMRLVKAIETVSVGKISGAVGTYEHLDPFVETYVCRKLGLKPAGGATQIIQRDSHAEYMTTLAIIASTLEKFSTEIRHMQRTEVLELEEPFTKGQKGSSAMPHKKNPVICERISGLARVVRSNSLAALENVNLWHERDISHSSVERMIIPDSTMLVYYMLEKMREVIDGLVVNERNILANINKTHGLIYSQKILLKLIEAGISREHAYRIVQSNAMRSWETGEGFIDLVRNDRVVKDKLTDEDINNIFNQKTFYRRIDYIYSKIGIGKHNQKAVKYSRSK